MARLRIRDEKTLKKAPRNPEGGWLPPDPKAYEKFWERIQKEAIQLFGVDEDGDACVLVRLLDNSRQESSIFSMVPVPRDVEESPYHPYGKRKWKEGRRDPKTQEWITPVHTPEEEEAREIALLEAEEWRRRVIHMNFEIARGDLDRMMREDEHKLRRKIDAPAYARAARIKKLEDLKTKWKDPYSYYEKMGYEVDRENNTYTHSDRDWQDVLRMRSKRNSKFPADEPKPVKKIEKPADFDQLMQELDKLKKYKPAEKLTF